MLMGIRNDLCHLELSQGAEISHLDFVRSTIVSPQLRVKYSDDSRWTKPRGRYIDRLFRRYKRLDSNHNANTKLWSEITATVLLVHVFDS